MTQSQRFDPISERYDYDFRFQPYFRHFEYNVKYSNTSYLATNSQVTTVSHLIQYHREEFKFGLFPCTQSHLLIWEDNIY